LATFFNQASVSLGGTVINSNVTVGEIVAGITMTKTAATESYSQNGGITYVVSIVNSGASASPTLTLTDNLGEYSPTPGTEVTPLDYIDGSVLYYVNGVLQPTPIVSAGPPFTVSGLEIPAGGNITVIYEARANGFAPLAQGAQITNVATVTGTPEAITDTATVPARESANLTVSKSLCPVEIADANGEITYTLVIQNSGNTPVVATDDLIINDVFNPILTNITVTLDGTALTEGVGYTYNDATGEFATTAGTVTVPAAIYTQDTATGIITTTPGVAVLTIRGRLS